MRNTIPSLIFEGIYNSLLIRQKIDISVLYLHFYISFRPSNRWHVYREITLLNGMQMFLLSSSRL
jgi:hypothetical protein